MIGKRRRWNTALGKVLGFRRSPRPLSLPSEAIPSEGLISTSDEEEDLMGRSQNPPRRHRKKVASELSNEMFKIIAIAESSQKIIMRFDKVVRQFVKMMTMGVRPTIASFVNVFPTVSRGGFDVAIANVYGLVVKFGK
ncbi:hypothetical protein LIER_31024 [Lithospermum erythrorhizon]|uniref:Uncharacterized protein n=1 Tax=Lithospermum erythrorhizon TaxID=34254 RepID=A0AAV3RTL8_LITER